jgi:hypothetical protein
MTRDTLVVVSRKDVLVSSMLLAGQISQQSLQINYYTDGK